MATVSSDAKGETFASGELAARFLAKDLANQMKASSKRSFVLHNVRTKGGTDLDLTRLLRIELQAMGLQESIGGIDVEARLQPLFVVNKNRGNTLPYGYSITMVAEDPEGVLEFILGYAEVISDQEANDKVGRSGPQRDQPPRIGDDQLIPIAHLPPAPSELIFGNKMRPMERSPYFVEILVRNADDKTSPFMPRKPRLEAGVLTVILNRGEEYRVRVQNDSAYEAYALLSIDGVRRFALSDDPKYRRNVDLIESGAARDLVGYYINQSKTSAFQIGSYDESVAKKIFGEAPDIGVISVSVGISYDRQTQLLEDETELYETEQTYTVQVPQAYTEEQAYTVETPAGVETRTRTVQVTRMVPETRSRTVQVQQSVSDVAMVGTTQGRDLSAPIKVEPRRLGLVRANIKVRYHAE